MLKSCKECGKEISSNAKKCPSCGKDNRSFFIKHKIISIIGILVILAAVGSGMNGNKNEPANAPVVAEQKEKVIEVDYRKLHKDYMDNAIKADSIYKDKLLRLTGTVSSIDREISGESYVTFDIEVLKNVRITFKKEEESKVAELKKGQKIAVEGMCKGTILSTTVALSDSILK